MTMTSRNCCEPPPQDYGIDFGLRNPFGNHIRVSQPIDT